MADNIVTKKDFNDFQSTFSDFEKKYDIDMRGDSNSSNGGRHGMVSDLRELRRCQEEYPSITWLLSHKAAKTWGAIIGVFVVLSSLMAVGALNVLGTMVGLKLP